MLTKSVMLFFKGILNEQGYLDGPTSSEDARFGMAISPVSDLNLDAFSDVVVGAPLEDGGKGVVYIYNGDGRTLTKQHSQVVMSLAITKLYGSYVFDVHGPATHVICNVTGGML